MISLENVTLQVCELAKKTALTIQHERKNISPGDISNKGNHDFVTRIDILAEQIIVDELKRIIPSAGFITEEGTETKKSDTYNWIIDPIDGTTNFIHGVPVYSISIALEHKNEIVLGVVYEINAQECFYSWKGATSYLNGTIIHCSNESSLDKTLIATGFPYTNYDSMDQYMDLFKELMVNTSGIRRLGSAAVDLVYVACGRFDAFYEYGLNPWDVAAGTFIAQQAGCINSDFKGDKNYIYGKQLLSAPKAVHDQILPLIQKYFV
ncbi:MAG: inositol monophosphatase [Bacteroidales bacterium]|nr:inositol monophosphatase [Bacteroidales bacterium]